MKSCILSLCLGLLYGGIATAQNDYYIDPLNGSDSNLGSAAAPWKTVMFALSFASDGDRIFCGPGTYSPSTNGDFLDLTAQPKAWIIGQAQGGIPQRLELIGAGADVCIANPEVDHTVLSFWCRVLFTGAGTKISGFTFTNPLQAGGRWNTVWRLGSTTAGYTVNDVEICNCIFDTVPRAYVSFGESFGTKFHDNLVINSSDAVAPTNFGAATGDLAFIYNNTFMNLTRSAVEILRGVSTGPCQVYLWNNNFVNVAQTTVWWDPVYSQPTVYTDYNNFWTVGTAYATGITQGANDTFVDPLTVSGTDPHLSATSPLIDAGTVTPSTTIPLPAGFGVYPPYGIDANGGQRYLDGDADNQLGIDVGGDEFHAVEVTGAGPYAIGSAVTFTVTDAIGRYTSTPQYLLWGSAVLAQPEVPVSPWGVLQLDVLSMYFVFTAPLNSGTASLTLPIPSNPAIQGFRLPFQFLVVDLAGSRLVGEFGPVMEIGL